MSATTAAARRPLPARAASAKSRPRLIVIASPRGASKGPFVALVGTLLLAGLLSLLMLHTLAAQDSFRQTSLEQRLANLTDTEQRLEQQVQIDSAPAALRDRAKALGMVPSVIVSYRRLPNGRTVAREVAETPVVTTPVTATTTTATTTTATTTAGTTTAGTTTAGTTTAGTTKTTTSTSTTNPTSTSSKPGTHHHHGAAKQ